MIHIIDVIFRAGVYRAFHFVPLWLALTIVAVTAIVLVTR
jgi:hypothetical protein